MARRADSRSRQLPPLGRSVTKSEPALPPANPHPLPPRITTLVARARELDGQGDEDNDPPSRPSSAYGGNQGGRPSSGSTRPGSASSSARSFFNGRTQPVPGPPAWWLGSGRESPATGLAGREAKHTPIYRAFSQHAELLLACIDESVQRSTVSTHIEGRTQMIDVATFWDAWEGEIPPEGALPEWQPYSGPFINAGRVHPNSLPLSFRIVIRNRTQRTILAQATTASFPVGMASVVYNDTPMAPGISQDLILTVDPSKASGEILADVTIRCEATATIQESRAGGADMSESGVSSRAFSMHDSRSSRSAAGWATGTGDSLSGTRMLEYTTDVHIPLYIWMC